MLNSFTRTQSQYITVKTKENIIKKYKENQIFS